MDADVPALKSASGLRAVGRENCLMRSSRDLRASPAQLANAVLHRRGAAVAETPLELLRELTVLLAEYLADELFEELGDRARLLGELRLDVARGLLELGLDELGVGAGLLAVEHARADLDGVADGLGGVVPVLLALPDDADGALVVDDEAVDRDDDRRLRGRGAA